MDNMSKAELDHKFSQIEKDFYKSSWTNNEYFDKYGYFIIKKLMDPEWVVEKPSYEVGKYHFYGSMDRFRFEPDDGQVTGSLGRYCYPPYQDTHHEVKNIIENHIGRKLYTTYYYDRFYYNSNELARHIDRPPCEISCTYHVGSNMKKKWPLWIKTPNTYDEDGNIIEKGEDHSVVLEPGDAMIYKGCECPHWREKMPNEFFNRKQYHHQLFYHYVLQDGIRSHFAFDN